MNSYLIIIFILIVLFLLYLNTRARLKSYMMQGNQLVQSESTSKVLNEMELKDLSEQEKKLMANPKYRAQKKALSLEIAYYKILSADDIEKTFKHTNIISKEIDLEGFKLVVQTERVPSATQSSLHFRVKPRSLFGAIFSIDEWLNY